MQYSIVFLAALTASVSAAPYPVVKDTSILITLSGPGDLGTSFRFNGNPDSKQHQMPATRGPFNEVSVDLGNDFPNKDIRCQLINDKEDTIVATRGANIDINFSDGGEAKPWDFLAPANVTKVICDPVLKKITDEEIAAQDQTFVTLDAEGVKHVKIGGFTTRGDNPLKTFMVPMDREFTNVNVKVGKFTNPQGLRCELRDHHNNVIEAKRGQNIDTTFSDAGKGKWDFTNPKKSVVAKITCDAKFKSANPPATPAVPAEPILSILPVASN